MKSKLTFLVYGLLVFYFSLFFAQKIELVTADLGRHLINGLLFLKDLKIISTNYYSFTEPNFPVVTHHWLSGVVFYLIKGLGGFTGLSFFYSIMSGLTVAIFLLIAKRKSNLPLAFLTAFLFIPLMADRKEIRPEVFSYLFLGLYYLAITLFIEKVISKKALFLSILTCQIFWVNLHLFFIMGSFVIGVFLAHEGIKKYLIKEKNQFPTLLLLFGSSLAVSLLNPFGVKGLIEPFNIFREYGYMIVENQPVLFMQKIIPRFLYFHYELAIVFLVFIVIHLFTAKRLKSFFVPLTFTIVFGILSMKTIRIIPVFGMFAVILISEYLYVFNKKLFLRKFIFVPIFLVIVSFIPGHYYSIFKPGFGYGLIKGIEGSANFFITNNLKGPIFNNYDIGGYLIYNLTDREKVFVDNRPEAYSVDFFKKQYIPMQENTTIWQEQDSKYNFNAIYFYRRDLTPWAQPFLITRLKDPNWVPVYVDDYVLILVKNNKENSSIIQKYELPKSLFSIS